MSQLHLDAVDPRMPYRRAAEACISTLVLSLPAILRRFWRHSILHWLMAYRYSYWQHS
jgi:hypothetical protein